MTTSECSYPDGRQPPGARRITDEETRHLLIGRMKTAGLSEDNADWVMAGWPYWYADA